MNLQMFFESEEGADLTQKECYRRRGMRFLGKPL
jgi:hypothetical protein